MPATSVYAGMKRAAFAAASLVLALGAPSLAVASKRPTYLAPPGNSALTQYLEVVPTAAGPAPPSSRGGSPATLAPGARRELKPYGSGGRLLEAVVAATAPSSAGGGLARGGDARARSIGSADTASSTVQKLGATKPGAVLAPSARGSSLAAAVSAQSPVSAVLAAATGRAYGGGIGIALPLLMALGVVGAVLSVAARRRSSRGS